MNSGSDIAQQNCVICGGTGFKIVRSESAKGERLEKAVTCDCRVISRAERLLQQARIPERYKDCELSTFDHVGPCKSLAPAYRDACRFIAEYPLEKKGLLLIGPIGVGKTHLAVSIIRQLILDKGISCLFYDYRELLKEIGNSYNASVDATELGVLDPVFKAEVLLLDELGGPRPTNSEWILETVQFILNTRYNAAKTTILTTNFVDGSSAELQERQRDRFLTQVEKSARQQTLGDRIGDRMLSRLHEMCRIVTMQGEDYRTKYRGARCD